MKRSEALNLLYEHINLNPEVYMQEEEIHDLLVFIETKVGMRPPFSSAQFIKQKDRWGVEVATGLEWDDEDTSAV